MQQEVPWSLSTSCDPKLAGMFCGDFRLHKEHKSCGSLLPSEFAPKTGTRPDTDGVSEQKVHQISHSTILFSLRSNNDIFVGIDVVTSFNLLNPTGDFTYHQVQLLNKHK